MPGGNTAATGPPHGHSAHARSSQQAFVQGFAGQVNVAGGEAGHVEHHRPAALVVELGDVVAVEEGGITVGLEHRLLVPGGVATACFKMATEDQARASGMVIGALDKKTGRFAIDHNSVRKLRQRLVTKPTECHDCFNRFHCAGECPDVCPLNYPPGTTFRCQVQKAITAAILQEAADALWSLSAHQHKNGKVYGTTIL